LTSIDQKENKKQVGDEEGNEAEQFELVGIQLNEIYLDTIERAKKAQSKLLHFNISNNENKCSCDNLLCYLALREHDLSNLQLRLAEQGLSLEMLESRVLVSIEQVLKHFGIPRINTVVNNNNNNNNNSSTSIPNSSLCKVNFQTGNMMLAKRGELLFGKSSTERRTHIMVTLDSSDIFQYELIEQLLENGMDIVRINCAHNTKREWKLLIESIRTAEERLVQREIKIGHKCKILMDLGGPKIRTGLVEHKPRPLKISVIEDVYGRPMRLAEGILDSEANQTGLVSLEGTRSGTSFVIAISKIDYGGLGILKIGQKISFRDARDERLCTLTVLERLSPTKVRVGLEHTAWLKEGTKLECQTNSFVESPGATVAAISSGDDGAGDSGVGSTTDHNYATDAGNDNNSDSNNNSSNTCSFTVGQIKPQPVEIKVEYGNTLRLYRNANRLGHTGDASVSNKPAGISCTHPEVLDHVVVGHRVFIDDGKIEGIVRSSNEEYLELEIISPKGTIAEIKPNKGMNFPDSSIIMPALTPEDIRNLEFVVEHADMVALSFVHRPEDIYDLHKELSKLEEKNQGNSSSKDLGVIAKIETADSIHNMAKILIAGLELELKFGILIARGDLAVEVGFENLPFIQEDILCLCEAAHTPVVLATQILESLAESGLRTRPEITDAIMGQRAECVMLNNGTHIVEAVKTLSALLNTEERHQIKKRQLLREFFTKQYIM
jgi:pyruvate kinase